MMQLQKEDFLQNKEIVFHVAKFVIRYHISFSTMISR